MIRISPALLANTLRSPAAVPPIIAPAPRRSRPADEPALAPVIASPTQLFCTTTPSAPPAEKMSSGPPPPPASPLIVVLSVVVMGVVLTAAPLMPTHGAETAAPLQP